MAEVLISPGIQITETDKSTVAGVPIVAGAALIGPTVKGPVLVPTKVSSYADYVRRFGTTFMTTQMISGSKRTIMQEFMTSMAAKSYFEQGGESILVTRVANPKAFKAATSTEITRLHKDGKEPFRLHTISTGEMLNNTKANDGTFSDSDDLRSDGSLTNGTKNNLRWEITDVNKDAGTFTVIIRRGDDTDLSPIILESYAGVSLDPLSENYIGAIIGDQHQVYVPAADYPQTDGTEIHVEAYIETTGDYTNKSAYVWVEVLEPTYQYLATDGVEINSDADGVSYADYLPEEQQGGFYGAEGKVGVIYDDVTREKTVAVMAEKKDEEGNPVLDDEGNPVMEATGETVVEKETTYGEVVEDTTGELCKYFGEITATTKYPQSVSPKLYGDAIELMENSDDYQINIISAPGLFGEDSMTYVDQMISLASKRGDCIAVVDLVTKDVTMPTVVAEKAQKYNSSYAATYWPWLQMYSSTGRLVWVPASVIIPGIYTYTDHVAAPWYAPAGTTRGSVQGVVQTAKKLVKGNRDILYAKNVNPIATFPGSGIAIYGQKTLQKKASALDRVNVRRLLIELKKRVKDMASGILFELNTAQLRNAFQTKLENYLETIVSRHGLYGFSVKIDDSAETIDRNEFRCQILIQPTKVIEFIYINFTITNTGVEFES